MNKLDLIKELRFKTSAGFLDCKKALEKTNNDLEQAISLLQKMGISKAIKKTSQIATEGIVDIFSNNEKVIILEINSQTDFAAKNPVFLSFVQKIGNILLKNNFKNIQEANDILENNIKIIDHCLNMSLKLGEKIILRRAFSIVKKSEEVFGLYTHVNKKIASIFVSKNGTQEMARNIAMHITSMNPLFLDENNVPSEKIQNIKLEINNSKALLNKPEKIKEHIYKGLLKKKLSEITLVDQEFVMDKITVQKYLNNFNAKALKMMRFELGEGIEKKEINFAKEVSGQMKF